jgi:Zn-dependent protease
MRPFFSSLRNIFGRKQTPSLPDEILPQHVWRRVMMTLLPPLSMLLSFGALTLLLPRQGSNWVLPIGLMFLLLTHELGHLLVLRLKGIPARGPYFIPLLGAFVMMSRPRKGEDVAQIALAGPFFGGLGALFCLVMAWVVGAHNCAHWTLAQSLGTLGSRFCYASGSGPQWLALAHIGFLFNLINLVPLLPFDGGQAIGIASRWFWLLGVPVGILFLLVTAQLTTPIGIMLSAVVLGTLLFSLGITCYTLWKPSLGGTAPAAFPPVPFVRRILILLLYLLLSSALFLGDNMVLAVLRQGMALPLNP